VKGAKLKQLAVFILAISMFAASSITVSAAKTEEEKAIENFSNWLSNATVVESGTVVSGSSTAPAGNANSSGPAASSQTMLTADELRAYADTVFVLVNRERQNAGLAPLERISLLDEAAAIRAAEIKVVDNMGGAPHTRPNGTSYKDLLTEMGVNGIRCGENVSRARPTPQEAMQSWMDSDGHRANILRENYQSIGIGVFQRPDGKIDCVQIFELR